MALNTPENITRLLHKLVEAINAGRDIGSLVEEVGLDNDDAQLVIKTLKKRIINLRTISKLSKEINELDLNIQGTSTSEQNRIARDLASRRASSNKRKMSFYENLGGLGYKLDARGNLIEASRYDYLRQKYYNRYAEFGDDGEVENRSEASRIASILARRQVRNEREEEERKRQEKENADRASRQEANIGARGRYRDAMRDIRDSSHMGKRRLYESFLEVDESTGKSSLAQKKAAAKKAAEVLAAEKANTKGVNENTKALAGIRAILGPYAKAFMPYYAANMLINGAKSDTAASVARVGRRTFGGLYGASKNIAGYNKMFRLMTSRGASEQDVMREYAGQKKWASTLMFGMGLDKIEALAMVLGKAPGPAEMRDPELMQKWLRENMRGITDLQAMQLSAMGVASDAFIEGARRGDATDADSRASTLKSIYDSLYEQTGLLDNPFRKAQYLIGSTAASDISSRTRVGVAASLAMSGLDMFGKMYEHGGLDLTSMIPGLSSMSDLWKIASGLFGGISSDNVGDFRTIPRQTSVTVNINGNIDSEERANSFAEQIGAEVSNAEK